ncbi:MAG: class I SAM-dependent methyltransferase, partial [Clostridia bacterium]|nr:class I SAM-dependent methyltransferase [Clostridia bacterium]
VYTEENSLFPEASRIADRIGSYAQIKKNSDVRHLSLFLDGEKLFLTDGNVKVCADFSTLKKRLNEKKEAGNSESIVKAAKIKKTSRGLTVFDATAGFGEDSFILAAAGFRTVLFEKNKIIFEMLRNAYERGKKDGDIACILDRMSVNYGDSIDVLKSSEITPDIVFLDPMFPERRKNGKIKKKFQLLQQLEYPCEDENELLQAAINVKPQKIIIKRPENGDFLAEINPSYSIKGDTIRYDCIVLANEHTEI